MLKKQNNNLKRRAKVLTLLSPVNKLAQIYLKSPSTTSMRKLPALISRRKAQSGTLSTALRENSGRKQGRNFSAKFSECLNKLEELIVKHPEIREDLMSIRGCVKESVRQENRQIQYLSRENYALSVQIENLESKLTSAGPVSKLSLDSKFTPNFHQEPFNRKSSHKPSQLP